MERYKPHNERISPWKTRSHKNLEHFIGSFFNDYISKRDFIRNEVETKYKTPRTSKVAEFRNGMFVESSISYKTEYSNHPDHFGLFTRDSFNPFEIYSLCKKKDSRGIPSFNLYWHAVIESRIAQFPDPEKVRNAMLWQQTCSVEVRKRMPFLNETENFELYRGKALDALKEQPGW